MGQPSEKWGSAASLPPRRLARGRVVVDVRQKPRHSDNLGAPWLFLHSAPGHPVLAPDRVTDIRVNNKT